MAAEAEKEIAEAFCRRLSALMLEALRELPFDTLINMLAYGIQKVEMGDDTEATAYAIQNITAIIVEKHNARILN